MVVERWPCAAALIGGGWEADGVPFLCENPATATTLCELPAMPVSGVNRAVVAARSAFEGAWDQTSPGRRQHTLARLAALVDAHADELAALESAENGVPIDIVRRFSVAAMGKNLAYYASWIDKIGGHVIPLSSGGTLDYVVPEPYGVVAILTA